MSKDDNQIDDLLAGAETVEKPPKKAKAAKAAAKPEAKPAAKKAKAATVAEKPAKKAKAAKAVEPAEKPAKKTKAEKAEGAEKATRNMNGDAVRAAISKVKKDTDYSTIAERGGFDVRSVRRTARTMRDAGEIELVKEGRTVFVRPTGI